MAKRTTASVCDGVVNYNSAQVTCKSPCTAAQLLALLLYTAGEPSTLANIVKQRPFVSLSKILLCHEGGLNKRSMDHLWLMHIRIV